MSQVSLLGVEHRGKARCGQMGKGLGVSLTEAGMALCGQHRLSQWERGSDDTVTASARLSVAAPQQAEQIPKKSDPRSGERGGHQGSGAVPPEEAADGGPRAEGGHLAGTQVAWSLGSTGIGAGGRASVRLFTSQCLVASSAS